MTQIFHPSMNSFARFTIFGGVLLLIALAGVVALLSRSSYYTKVGVVRPQPVAFSHQHHVGQLGIDCRFCHTSVETSSSANVPATEICMQCHSQIWAESPKLEPVRESYRTGQPLRWTRVHDLPDFAYFNHSIHVQKGVACVTCHGRVDQMPLMWRVESLHMEWCLDCHRHPERYVVPRDQVFSPEPVRVLTQPGVDSITGEPFPAATVPIEHAIPEEGTSGLASAVSGWPAGESDRPLRATAVSGQQLVEDYHIHKRTDCSVCHR